MTSQVDTRNQTAERIRRTRSMTLCFHGIGEPGRPLEDGEERFWITPERFAEIVHVARSHPRPVQFTFDDSNESDVTEALPLLTALDLRAEFFIIAGRLDSPGSLTTEQVRQLARSGMEIGSHGMWHRPWREIVDDQVLEEEISGSAAVLERVTGLAVSHAACPRGSYDRRVLHALRRHGYTRVYTVDEGTSSRSAWLQSRYTVISSDDATTITARLDAPGGAIGERLVREGKNVVKRWR